MNITQDAAREIDRLVLSLYRAIGPKHGGRLVGLAHELGLESLEFLPLLGDFLLTGALTQEVALLRMRYSSPERLLGWLDELDAKDLIENTDDAWRATPTLRPLLESLVAAETEIATEAWKDHDSDVGTVGDVAQSLIAAASDDHRVAVAHRELPQPSDPYLLLFHRLVGVRYIRQQDHITAWEAPGLTAPEMVVLTKLWLGEDVADYPAVMARLALVELATNNPPALTEAGLELREAIEVDTNAASQRTFDTLDDASATEFLAALQRLPGIVG
jgi:hypothetical protein